MRMKRTMARRWTGLAAMLMVLALAGGANALTYPICPSGTSTSAGYQQQTGCTMVVHITSSATPVLLRFPGRSYMFLQNLGYDNSSPPVLNNNVVWCAVGSSNAPSASGSTINSLIIQPGAVWEPVQMRAPQIAGRVPTGDISCIAPSGDVYLAVEQE